MKDREFSFPGKEFYPPAPEFTCPAQEQNRAGREFGQSAGAAAPHRKRRRVPGFMFAAAAVVTAMVALSAPAPVELPQPENFTAEYRAYLDEIMEACETEDPLTVHRLGTDPIADEFWYDCMEPYVYEVVHRGFPNMVYYDGEEMTTDPGSGPALYFWHSRSTLEQISEQHMWEYYTDLIYCRDGSQRSQETWGASYSTGYGMIPSGPENDFFQMFRGEMTLNEDAKILYRQGTWQSYDPYGYGYGYGDVPPDTPQLQSELTGTFCSETLTSEDGTLSEISYLENGTWTQHFHHGLTEVQIVDGSIVLNEHLELEPAEVPGRYKGMTIWSSDRTDGGRGWSSPDQSLTLEELLYHHPHTRAY